MNGVCEDYARTRTASSLSTLYIYFVMKHFLVECSLDNGLLKKLPEEEEKKRFVKVYPET